MYTGPQIRHLAYADGSVPETDDPDGRGNNKISEMTMNRELKFAIKVAAIIEVP